MANFSSLGSYSGPSRHALLLAGVAALMSACASYPKLAVPPATTASSVLGKDAAQMTPGARVLPSGAAEVLNLPGPPPVPSKPAPPPATAAEIAQAVPERAIDVTLPPQPVPQFLNTVFGEVLKAPYSLGPNVSARTEIITLRSAPQMSSRAFVGLVQTALRDYGLVLSIQNGAIQVNEGGAAPSDRAVLLRGRSSADTPDTSRTVTQFVQLYTLESAAVQPLLQDLFPASRAVKITPQPNGNYLVLAGTGRDVAAAVDMITSLDQPRFAGAKVARIEPTYWRAEAFAKALSDAMTTEGFIVSNTPTVARGVMILPLATTNQVLAFAGDETVMERIQFWVKQIDQPSAVGEQRSTFVYVVRNTDAASLGALARGHSPETFTPTPPVGVGVPGAPPISVIGPTQTPQATAATIPTFNETANANSAGQLPGGGSIVVDSIGNRILFTGSATQFAQLRDLLTQLDVPPRQVLIEVTVAEVTLTDTTTIGLEWFFNQSNSSETYSGGTRGGLGLGNQGLNLSYLKMGLPHLQSLQAQFNAFASNNNVNILSRPRIVAKSGGDAQIQVGTDIPIISSQAAGNVQTNGSTQVLQTVQYRQTGIILKVKPTIYGDNRIDLEISQEVSNQLGSSSGAIASPAIQNRSISTALSLEDGATAVLGGLMSNNYTKSNSGIPYLKDIPILGTAFKTNTLGGDRDALVVLVTPHVIHDADEMSAVAGSLSKEIDRAFRVGTGWSYTLSPLATGVNFGAGPPARPRSPDLNAAIAGVRAGEGAPAATPPGRN